MPTRTSVVSVKRIVEVRTLQRQITRLVGRLRLCELEIVVFEFGKKLQSAISFPPQEQTEIVYREPRRSVVRLVIRAGRETADAKLGVRDLKSVAEVIAAFRFGILLRHAVEADLPVKCPPKVRATTLALRERVANKSRERIGYAYSYTIAADTLGHRDDLRP